MITRRAPVFGQRPVLILGQDSLVKMPAADNASAGRRERANAEIDRSAESDGPTPYWQIPFGNEKQRMPIAATTAINDSRRARRIFRRLIYQLFKIDGLDLICARLRRDIRFPASVRNSSSLRRHVANGNEYFLHIFFLSGGR